jgi:phage regulator Rha-like protein
MLDELGLDAPEFSGTYRTDRGNEYECFNLPHRETMILVSGYSLPMRTVIIDRWQELESKQGPQIPQDWRQRTAPAAESLPQG